jgi:hypothetical protein
MISRSLREFVIVALVLVLEMASHAVYAAKQPRYPTEPNCRVELPKEVLPVDFVIDDSKSMIGFLRGDSLRYWECIGSLINGVASGMSAQVHRLSPPNAAVTNVNEARGQSFYGDDDTPLSAAFAYAADRRGAVVIVSDLQQDEAGRDVNALTESVRSAVLTHPFVSIIGYELPYLHRHKKDERRTKQQPVSQHLYAVVMTSTLQTYEQLTSYMRGERLSAQQTSVRQITPRRKDGPFLFSSMAFRRIPTLDEYYVENGWHRDRDPKPVNCSRGPAVVYSWLAYVFEYDPPPLHFRVHATTTLPVNDPRRIAIQVCEYDVPPRDNRLCREIIAPDGTNVATIIQQVPHDNTGLTEYNNLEFEVEYRLPLPEGVNRAFYRATFRLGQANVEAPPWVDDWNTVDIGDETKTLNLKAIVDTIIRSVTEREPFLVHEIELSRRTRP